MADKKTLHIAVVGGRTFDDYLYMESALDLIMKTVPIDVEVIIVSGGARGADTLAERYARKHGLKMKIFKADWQRYGKSAGYIRNPLIANVGDRVVAFWNGESKGTKHTISLFEEQGKTTEVHLYEEPEPEPQEDGFKVGGTD